MGATSFDTIFTRLSSSKFRASFHLTKVTRAYVEQKGLPIIKQHAEDFISTRLAPAYIPNDGKQTPMKGHPVFIAQHACAACCRDCLEKWYGISKNHELSAQEQAAIIAVLMAWIKREIVQ
jgi:uncharacterized protein DUF4186